MLSIFISVLITCCIGSYYPSPLRYWQSGYWEGNPLYSPLGRFNNYSMIFRPNDGRYKDYLMIETGITCFPELNQGTYQQWTIVDNQITYCGLLTFNGGQSYMITTPRFMYYPDLSSENEVYFCADPRGGGCDQLEWRWIFNNETNVFRSVNTVGGLPHQDTLLYLQSNMDAKTAPIQTLHREMCTYLLGHQEPYDYEWISQPPNGTNSRYPKVEKLTNENRERVINSIPNYHKYHEMRKNIKSD